MNLFGDEPLQDVEDEAHQTGVHGQRLQHCPHEESGEGVLLH